MKRAYKLREIDTILEVYSSKQKVNDINHILDLYAIYELLKDETHHLAIWDNDTYIDYKNTSKEFPRSIGVFVSKVTDENFLDIFDDVSTLNKFDFWKLFFKCFRTVVVLVLNYLGRKFLIFKKDKVNENE